MSNYPPGAEFDSSAPYNSNDFEYNIISIDKKGIYAELELDWGLAPKDDILYPRIVKIDLDLIYDILNRQLGRG